MKLLKSVFLFLGCLLLSSSSIWAQLEPKFGFRAGMTISTIFGPSETDADGKNLERYKAAARISVGPTMQIAISDYIGVSAELLFSQKGAQYRYEGNNSFLKLPSLPATFEGHDKIIAINVTNGYIEIPALFYVRPIPDRLHFEFGPSISFLMSSRGLGIMKYGIIDPVNPDPTKYFEITLDHKFMTDKEGGLANNNVKTGKLDQTTITYPESLGGYYFYSEKKGSYYKPVDFGLNFGTSLYFTKGLRVGARAYYGLTDVTNNRYDFSQKELDVNQNVIPRQDKDINFGVQLFIGLQF